MSQTIAERKEMQMRKTQVERHQAMNFASKGGLYSLFPALHTYIYNAYDKHVKEQAKLKAA